MVECLTKRMSVGGGVDTVSLDGKQIEEVQDYKYLGFDSIVTVTAL